MEVKDLIILAGIFVYYVIRAMFNKEKKKGIEWEYEADIQEKKVLEDDVLMEEKLQTEQIIGGYSEKPFLVDGRKVVELPKTKHVQPISSSKKEHKLASMLKTPTGARQAFIMSEVMKRVY